MDFVSRLKVRRPDLFIDKKVLEIGSYNVNGSVREFWSGCEYVGVDWREGPGVDVVVLGHHCGVDKYDVVVCVNTLEHDKHWRDTLETIGRARHAIVTVASFDYPEHHEECGIDGHYRNIQPEDIPFRDRATIWEEDRIQQELRIFV